jgi:hypothetical protein
VRKGLLLPPRATETVAYLRQRGPIMLMFCPFSGRLASCSCTDEARRFCRATLLRGTVQPLWECAGVPAFVVVDVEPVASSCGDGLPVTFEGLRDQFDRWTKQKHVGPLDLPGREERSEPGRLGGDSCSLRSRHRDVSCFAPSRADRRTCGDGPEQAWPGMGGDRRARPARQASGSAWFAGFPSFPLVSSVWGDVVPGLLGWAFSA